VLTIKAPAKINLTLEVLKKRPDGFHEIRSVLQTIDLYDTLHIEPGEGVTFQSNMQGWSPVKSLLSKAVSLLQEATGVKKGTAVRIEKRIPLMSGLGGDSSGAAALLKGLNEFWDLKLSNEKLTEIAVGLGSDVGFFLKGGTALATGRGEKISPLPLIGQMWLVLVLPDMPVEMGKTGRMYSSLKLSYFTDGSITQKVTEALNQGKPFRPAMLFNVFENVAFEDFMINRLYVEPLKKMGALHVHLAGSGPMLFTMTPDKARAGDMYRQCKAQGMKAYLASTI
jgi:4-diphosphocytidyl-2-C-methyl-D-erythritol kinase